ncbi:MAG: quinolinate synthase NadA [Peptococcaceae bacterium]|nr:quinolinate synthase NadA [Peptococcaceae bacterium]
MTLQQQQILTLKKEKSALILAHYYQTTDIQAIADHVCDSFELARRASLASEKILVICGVRFMAESAKILSPDKTVLLPVPDAGCPMADMIEPQDVLKLRQKYPEAAVVCYVNSSAAVKAVSDICCTSSSAVQIVRSLPHQQILFVPDRNLGAYVAKQVPEKEIILFSGCCPIHHQVTVEDIQTARRAHPQAQVLMHPECRPEVLAHADYIGSTAGIIDTALHSSAKSFLIATEQEITELLAIRAPHKEFYRVNTHFICPDMKKNRLTDIADSLIHMQFEIKMTSEDLTAAALSLRRMVEGW